VVMDLQASHYGLHTQAREKGFVSSEGARAQQERATVSQRSTKSPSTFLLPETSKSSKSTGSDSLDSSTASPTRVQVNLLQSATTQVICRIAG
jgi:hypothetical protein